MEKDTKGLLQHLLNFWDIYHYVAAGKKSTAEIKSYLIDVMKMSDTTTRRYLGTITTDMPGMFLVGKSDISINKELFSEVIGEVLKELQIASDGISKAALVEKDEQIAVLEEKVKELSDEISNASNELTKANETIAERDQQIQYWEEKNKQLVKEQIERQLDRKVIFVKDVSIVPAPDAEDAAFLNDSYVKLDIKKSISKYGGARASFYETEESEDSHTLTKGNYFRRIAEKIMSPEILKRWVKDMDEERAFREEQGIESNGSSAKERDFKQAYRNKSEVQRHADDLIRKRKFAVQNIMNDDRLTDQMKLQMYARFGEYRGTELERLINFAADYGINAKWFIQVIEDPDSLDNYENIRDYLRLFAKPSEYNKKMEFARELLDGVWKVKMEYDGKPTYFAFVPVSEINEIRERLLLPRSEFTAKDFLDEEEFLKRNESEKKTLPERQTSEAPKENVSEKKIENPDKKNVSELIEKPDFVSTYTFKEDEPDQDAEEFGLDVDAIDYGEFEEMGEEQ